MVRIGKNGVRKNTDFKKKSSSHPEYHTSIKRLRRWKYPSGASVNLQGLQRGRLFLSIFSPFAGSSIGIWQRRWHFAAAK